MDGVDLSRCTSSFVLMKPALGIIVKDEKHKKLLRVPIASNESGLKDEKSNHALYMKERNVVIIPEENIMSKVGAKLTSNITTEEYNDIYRALKK